MVFDTYILKFDNKPLTPSFELPGNSFTFEEFQEIYSKMHHIYLYGINDVHETTVGKKWYKTWHGIFERAHNRRNRQSNKSYIVASVDYSWFKSSKFKYWYESSIYKIMSTNPRDKLVIDKDIRIPGNKLYASHTCLIIPTRINEFFVGAYKPYRSYTLDSNNRYHTDIRDFNNSKIRIGFRSSSQKELAILWAQEKNKQLKEKVIPYFINLIHPSDMKHPMVQLVIQALNNYDFVEVEKGNKPLNIVQSKDDSKIFKEIISSIIAEVVVNRNI